MFLAHNRSIMNAPGTRLRSGLHSCYFVCRSLTSGLEFCPRWIKFSSNIRSFSSFSVKVAWWVLNKLMSGIPIVAFEKVRLNAMRWQEEVVIIAAISRTRHGVDSIEASRPQWRTNVVICAWTIDIWVFQFDCLSTDIVSNFADELGIWWRRMHATAEAWNRLSKSNNDRLRANQSLSASIRADRYLTRQQARKRSSLISRYEACAL